MSKAERSVSLFCGVSSVFCHFCPVKLLSKGTLKKSIVVVLILVQTQNNFSEGRVALGLC